MSAPWRRSCSPISPASRPLRETALPAFWDGVMRRVAEVLDAHQGEVACRNSWGDALYAVMPEAPAAATIALDLQDALADLRLCDARPRRRGRHADRRPLRPRLPDDRPYHRPDHLLRHRGLEGGADRAGDSARRGLRHRALRRHPRAGGGRRASPAAMSAASRSPRNMAITRCTGSPARPDLPLARAMDLRPVPARWLGASDCACRSLPS